MVWLGATLCELVKSARSVFGVPLQDQLCRIRVRPRVAGVRGAWRRPPGERHVGRRRLKAECAYYNHFCDEKITPARKSNYCGRALARGRAPCVSSSQGTKQSGSECGQLHTRHARPPQRKIISEYFTVRKSLPNTNRVNKREEMLLPLSAGTPRLDLLAGHRGHANA